MPSLYPQLDTFHQCFASPLSTQGTQQPAAPETRTRPTTRYQARPEFYSAAFSTVDDAKGKAAKLSDEATREFEKASKAAQAKAGKIELYSGKYYAACTFGGLLACVCIHPDHATATAAATSLHIP